MAKLPSKLQLAPDLYFIMHIPDFSSVTTIFALFSVATELVASIGVKLNNNSFGVRTLTLEAHTLLISNVLTFGQDLVQLC